MSRSSLLATVSHVASFKMQYLALLAGLLASAAAVPTSDTLKICDYLYQKYPNFLAYDTLGLSALKTVANASQYTVSLEELE